MNTCPECGAQARYTHCSRSCAATARERRRPKNGIQSADELTKTISRFWAKVDRRGDGECWPWLGEVNNQGYGRFNLWRGRRKRLRIFAHRLSLQLAGQQVSSQSKVLHHCDNPPCVNPAHLWVGSQTDNMRDALAKGRLDLSGLAIGQYGSTQKLIRNRQGAA